MSAALTTLPQDAQRRVYDEVDLAGLAASARVSRAWLRSVRENSILLSIQHLRLWPAARLRKLAVHLTWQSIVQAPPASLPTQTGAAKPLLILDGLAAWLAHDNEHEAGLQLLEHVKQLVSVAQLPGMSVLPTSRVLHFSAPTPETLRQTHIRITFSLSPVPEYRFYLKLDFEHTRNGSLSVMCQKRDMTEGVMDVLFMSDASGLHIVRGASVGFDQRTNMFLTRPASITSKEGIVTKAFLNGTCLLVCFVYAPAARQFQRQIDNLMI